MPPSRGSVGEHAARIGPRRAMTLALQGNQGWRREGLPMPREPAYADERSQDGGAKSASSERRAWRAPIREADWSRSERPATGLGRPDPRRTWPKGRDAGLSARAATPNVTRGSRGRSPSKDARLPGRSHADIRERAAHCWVNANTPRLLATMMSGRPSPLRSPTVTCVPTPLSASTRCGTNVAPPLPSRSRRNQ